jgi:putative flippase GtrA
MSWLRQGKYFVLVGILQWLVDWSVAATLCVLGIHVAYANVAGRVSGALFGFWLNGSFTFSQTRERSSRSRQLLRYAALWCTATAASTAGVVLLNRLIGLRGALMGKLIIDTLLALCSFLASRYWVFR